MPDSITSVFNDAYIAETYELWQRDPSSVEESWRQFFELAQRYGSPAPAHAAPVPVAAPSVPGAPGAWAAAPSPSPAPVAPQVLPGADSPSRALPDQDFARRVVGISRYLNAIRRYGFLAVQLDPLGSSPPGAVELHIEEYGITEADLDLLTGEALGFPHLKTGRDVAERLKHRYTRNIAVEFVHCGTDEERQWFRQLFTAEQLTRSLTPDEKRALLTRLSQVDGLERFLGRAFVGYKRFSIEGTDTLVPMLDTAIGESAAAGARHIAISMAHRGRLNVLTHIMGKPFDEVFAEFEGRHDHLGGAATGDVKYHLGYEHEVTVQGRAVQMTLVPNPSHLEVVNPVLQGVTRALQRNATDPYERDDFAVVPICIHGDAAFPGEGIVAETFNLAHLRGYSVGGTLHVIVNNQVGFTTDPSDARTTRFASDLAKGFEMPIIHVNADDPEACVIAMRIAVAYRTTFGRDFVVDLVGYRRHGHNEGDEPAYTQPLLYDQIRAHPTVRQLWGRRLVKEGVVSEADVDAAEKAVSANLQRVYDATNAAAADVRGRTPEPMEQAQPPVTSVPVDLLNTVNDALLTWPETFTPHPRLAKQLERRRDVMDAVGGIDWGHAEALAFATILADGTSIRLTGQDAERGTFSHRHAVLHDVKTNQTWTPLQHIAGSASAFEIYNSPLSELAVMGFEYGFSVTARQTLTLWEAQFGDFVNMAQPVIDQFLAADRAKWGQDSGLVLLLPHGYEGQGPEHSSARLERFLQLAAEDNLRVAYPSNPAQYFHVMRRQSLMRHRRPLVLMQPKSLLRLQQAMCRLTDLSEGAFHTVIDDPDGAPKREKVTRIILCTGKIYYDIVARDVPDTIAVVRVEELFPWPHADLTWLIDAYTSMREVVWVQEEPKNQGAWSWVAPRLRATVGNAVMIRYVGRPERASPAEGYTQAHNEEQARIVGDALSAIPRSTPSRRSSGVLHIV